MNAHVPNQVGHLKLPPEVLDRLMPMHITLDNDGCVRHTGPTIAKIMGLVSGTQACVFDLFDIRRSDEIEDFPGLLAVARARLSLIPKSAPHLNFRGVIMPLAADAGALLDISFGLSFARAVKEFSLSLPDFSPCDQTVELLYLLEASTHTAQLSRHLSERLQSAHDAAQHQARTDVLTTLGNRRALDDELNRLLSSRNQEFTLLHLDLDRFKGVNDTFGHAAGDAVLKTIGRILSDELRRDDFPARVGGDEFLTILRPALTDVAAGSIARRLIDRIETPITVKQDVCKISASIGLVSTTQYDTRPSAEQMMADADAALYKAKNNGRGGFAIFDPHLDP